MNRVFIIALAEEVNFQTKILGSPVIFTGVGKINAAIGAYKAFTEGYKEIINIGSCGSVIHKNGTVLKIGSVYQDIDCRPLSDYGHTFGEPFSDKIIIDGKIQKNTCFTTDYFVDLSQKEKYSNEYLNKISECSVFDMECFAIAKIAKRFNLKFKAYKWVSDNGGGESWLENCKLGFEEVKKILNE
jgi:adenosylhomocysteine nucleosidase